MAYVLRPDAWCANPSLPRTRPLTRWVWAQRWDDVVFLHWRLEPSVVRKWVPASLELETWDHDAWVSVVAFRLSVRHRGLPHLPGLSHLLEINLRTYVTYCGRPGIWLLSAHADNGLAIGVARQLTPMPYVRADLKYYRDDQELRWQATSGASTSDPFVLWDTRVGLATIRQPFEQCNAGRDHWLLERYRLYVTGRGNSLRFADVEHLPWRIGLIRGDIAANRLGAPFNLDLSPAPDCAHFSPGVAARFGAFCKANPGDA